MTGEVVAAATVLVAPAVLFLGLLAVFALVVVGLAEAGEGLRRGQA